MKLASSEGEELEIVAEIGRSAPASYYGNDRSLSVRLVFSGFTASTKAWIDEKTWSAFLNELADLERSRRGKASLAAMSPEELQLTFRSIDRGGHLAVEGFVGVRSGGGYAAKLTFSSLKFDPSELPRVLRELQSISPIDATRARPAITARGHM